MQVASITPNGLALVKNVIDAGRLLGALQGQVDPNKGVDMTLLKEVLLELGINRVNNSTYAEPRKLE